MTVLRHLLAAALATCTASSALAQYVPTPPPPAPPAQPTPPPQQPPSPPPSAQPPPTYPPTQPTSAALHQEQPPRLQIAATTGWQVNGDVDGIYGRVRFDDAQSFGLSLWTTVRGGTKVELLWIYSTMTARYDSFTLAYPSSQPFDVMTNYFQLGGVHTIRRGKVEPFFGGTLGTVWFSPDDIRAGLTTYHPSDTWRFAVTVGGGLNIFLTKAVAIRGYARMLVPMYFNGGSIYVGTGGSGLAVNAGVPAVSGDFGGALVFAR